jgi:membrane protein DedA with SNARE-associated domain
VYFLVSLAVLIHTSGYIQGRYLTFVNWDILAHTVSGTIVALIGFLVILFWDKIKNYNLDAAFVGIFIVFFGCVFEYLWEIWEFGVDSFLGGSAAGLMQANNADTMSDMIFVLVASLIVGMGCYYYLKRYGKVTIFREMVKDSTYAKKFNV